MQQNFCRETFLLLPLLEEEEEEEREMKRER